MATLGTLRDELRNRKLVESATDFYSESELLDMVIEASREIAAAFRFPKKVATTTESAGTVAISLPAGGFDVVSVGLDGVSIPRVSYPYVKFMQGLVTETWPRGWNWDADRGGDIQVGPPAAAGDFDVLYMSDPYASTPVGGTQVWDGLYPGFHELVALRAAVKAFEQGFEFENSQYYFQRYAAMLQEFAQFLGSDVPRQLQAGGA